MTALLVPIELIRDAITAERLRGVPEHHPERSPVREPLGRWPSHPATITEQRGGWFLVRCERRGCDWQRAADHRGGAVALHTDHAGEASAASRAGRDTA